LPDRRGVHLEDAADNEAISDYVEVIVVPLAGWTRSRCALDDQIIFFHRPSRMLPCWVIISLKPLVLKERALPAGFIAPCLPTKAERRTAEVRLRRSARKRDKGRHRRPCLFIPPNGVHSVATSGQTYLQGAE
jgi:hypothetical protein